MDHPNKTALPYVNNIGSILITILINAVCVAVFHIHREITRDLFLASMLFCGIITSIVDVLVVDHFIGQTRKNGQLPTKVPESRLMQCLPRNKWLLMPVLAVVFGFLSWLVNDLLIQFYEITQFNLLRLIVWQAAFASILTGIITELTVLRLVQPDCATIGQPEQTGTAEVKNPLPKMSGFKSWFNTVTDDFGFNMIFGLLLGGTQVMDHNVIIAPTTLSGIVISSLIMGLIVTLRMAYPIAKSMRALRLEGQLPVLKQADPFISRLPASPGKLAALLALPIMLLSLLVFWSVLTFFGFRVLNFFQFFVIRTIYVGLLSKAMVKLAVTRYVQPEGAFNVSAG